MDYSLLALFFFTNALASSPQELTFLNWSEYIDPELVQKFENEFNAKIHLVTFGSDDERNQLLISTNGMNFDVAVVDGESIHGYVRRGWLAKVSEKEIPNIKNIIPNPTM